MPMVVHVVAGLHPRAGGPSRTVVQLTDGLARRSGQSVTLVTQRLAGVPTVLSAEPKVVRLEAETRSRMAFQMGLPLHAELAHMRGEACPQLIHSHGLWTPANHWAARAARNWTVPLIIHPRGMLEPWALDQKAWKKWVALTLYQRHDLLGASLFVATAESEYQSIRTFGLLQPVAVIPNGVDCPAVPAVKPKHDEATPRTALFLSRVHPKKGLLNLLQAWARVAPMGWRLRLAGPDEDGHLAEVMALGRQLGIDELIEYVGEVDGAEKVRLYSEAELFVLPTFSENFGVVVAEALAHGLPVITTRGAPWAGLQTHSCGWWVDIGVEPLVHALREATALSDDERRAMGARGRVYVQRYNWGDIAQQTIEVYRWVLGQGPKPPCVRTD